MNRRRLKEKVAVLEAELLKLGIVVCDEGNWYFINTGLTQQVAYFRKGLFTTISLTKNPFGQYAYDFSELSPEIIKGCKLASHLEVKKSFQSIFEAMGLKLGSTLASSTEAIKVDKYTHGKESEIIIVDGPRVYFEGYLMVDMVNKDRSRVVVDSEPTIAVGDWVKFAGQSKGFCKIGENELVSIVNKDPGVEELLEGAEIHKKGSPSWRRIEVFYNTTL